MIRCVPRWAGGGILCLLLIVGWTTAGAPLSALEVGWQRIEIPATGSYALVYLPRGLEAASSLPLVVFLHGSGGEPEPYQRLVENAADDAGCVLVLPRSRIGTGWGAFDDPQTIAESVATVSAELPVDPARIAIAGHSAGGAYAFHQAYAVTNQYSGVFALSSPTAPVNALADRTYVAPNRMYYGTTDPNYTDGAYANNRALWQRLEVRSEEDIQPGFGHNVWPSFVMRNGFRFLVEQRYPAAVGLCRPDATTLCLRDGRFALSVSWRDDRDRTGEGGVVTTTADSGLFWFFGADNWELLVKVLDGCADNQRFWVFTAATTNVEYELTVRDLEAGVTKIYRNPLGVSARTVADTAAFATCP
ncbi:MAG: alpha/beta hydrolase [Acidobacteriota bacterium]